MVFHKPVGAAAVSKGARIDIVNSVGNIVARIAKPGVHDLYIKLGANGPGDINSERLNLEESADIETLLGSGIQVWVVSFANPNIRA